MKRKKRAAVLFGEVNRTIQDIHCVNNAKLTDGARMCAFGEILTNLHRATQLYEGLTNNYYRYNPAAPEAEGRLTFVGRKENA